ncbi:hypothetical protein FH972_025875 [Carpinus fangiana]|uniref:Uncharacterized protein n=1 Tax=Carpinus fangiana TaxID=176857 RepID=A0A5N6L2A3_9ROSI|nr:hypothetical protein FH972_025875 [Carpinus fangiana]
MAAADRINKSHDKASKKKPFAWVKKLTHFGSGRDSNGERKKSPKKAASNAPDAAIPQTDGIQPAYKNGQADAVDDRLREAEERHEEARLHYDLPTASNGEHNVDSSNRSAAPTLNTNGDASDAGQSKSGTTSGNTAGAGGDSIFSSSNPSARSLTTTLTTMQSTAAHGQTQPHTPGQASSYSAHHSQQPSQGSTYFSHQYPTAPVASAVPPHVTGGPSSHLPTTYRSATANNLLSDNASVMTLASSHHNRRIGDRRNSADTNASVRAIPPSSQWGGSRESLPLSTVSTSTADQGQQLGAAGVGQTNNANNIYQATTSRPSIGGLASTERHSIYSSSAMTPTGTGLVSERNSLYASSRGGTAADNASLRGLTGDANSIRGPLTDGGASIRGEKGADGASVHSSVMGGHGRNDSTAGSIGPLVATSTAPRSGEEVDGSGESTPVHVGEA